MKHLNTTQITFNPQTHTYTLPNGQTLPSVTELLGKYIFTDKYSNIPDTILSNAADRGHTIHAMCQFEDELGWHNLNDNPEYQRAVEKYTSLRKLANAEAIKSEYLVSDLTHCAGQIDSVWQTGEELSLVDIKTTYQLDTEYLSWQLSIYAYLFEKQNPDYTIANIYGVWLPFRNQEFKEHLAKLVPINRRPNNEIATFLQTHNVPATKKNTIPIIAPGLIEQYIAAEQELTRLKQQQENFKKALLAAMNQHGIRTFDAQRIRATLTPPTQTQTFDTTRFKEDFPEIYNSYLKTTTRKPSLRLTIR